MEWVNKPIQWDNEGTEPSDTLKASGFSGGYKPPAGVFNAFLNRTQKCIEELQTAVAEGAGGGSLIFQNKNVPTTLWVADTTYQSADFHFKADIECEGVTADYMPNVILDVAEAMGGNLAPVAETGDGVVTIYAMEKPASVITIPLIECVKVVG